FCTWCKLSQKRSSFVKRSSKDSITLDRASENRTALFSESSRGVVEFMLNMGRSGTPMYQRKLLCFMFLRNLVEEVITGSAPDMLPLVVNAGIIEEIMDTLFDILTEIQLEGDSVNVTDEDEDGVWKYTTGESDNYQVAERALRQLAPVLNGVRCEPEVFNKLVDYTIKRIRSYLMRGDKLQQHAAIVSITVLGRQAKRSGDRRGHRHVSANSAFSLLDHTVTKHP
nr:hypothetical protein [Tanacetum cinerariifolium]